MIEEALKRARVAAAGSAVLRYVTEWAMPEDALNELKYELRDVATVSNPTCTELKYMGIPVVADDAIPAGEIELRTDRRAFRIAIEPT